MVSWLHIVSVGTSILANYERLRADEARELGVAGWSRASPEDPVQSTVLGHARPESRVFRALLSFVEEDPCRASAELNAFLRYTELSGHAPPEKVGVLLYSSDTGTGYLCARLVYEYLKKKGYRLLTEPIKVEGLGRGPEKLDDALASLMNLVVTRIVEWRKRGARVYVNATGGFKPETTFLVISFLCSRCHSSILHTRGFPRGNRTTTPTTTPGPRTEIACRENSREPASQRERVQRGS